MEVAEIIIGSHLNPNIYRSRSLFSKKLHSLQVNFQLYRMLKIRFQKFLLHQKSPWQFADMSSHYITKYKEIIWYKAILNPDPAVFKRGSHFSLLATGSYLKFLTNAKKAKIHEKIMQVLKCRSSWLCQSFRQESSNRVKVVRNIIWLCNNQVIWIHSEN